MKIRYITTDALMVAVAIVIFVAESFIPFPLPVPGAKLGLSNIITLVTLYMLGERRSFVILFVRITISSFIYAGLMTFVYSLAGGVAAFVIMVLFKRIFSVNSMVISAAVAGAFHNLGQLAVAGTVLKSMSVMVYLPPLIVIGAAAGAFTGLASRLCIKNKHICKLFGSEK